MVCPLQIHCYYLKFLSISFVSRRFLYSPINHGLLLSLQTEFPANTNILYVDLNAAELIGSSKDETSLPGMVLNVKKSINFVDHFGIKHGYVFGLHILP